MYPIGAVVEFYDTPESGVYLPTGTIVDRVDYPELSAYFPDPKMRYLNDATKMQLGVDEYISNKYMRVK